MGTRKLSSIFTFHLHNPITHYTTGELFLKNLITSYAYEEDMNKIIILSTILAGLAGCSSSDGDPTNVSATVTTAQLIGTWRTACQDEDPGSYNASLTFNDTSAIIVINTFSDAGCQTPIAIGIGSFTYTLGADFTLDGTVAGITTGTEIDFTDDATTETDYDSIAIVGDLLYLGDDGADPLKDTTTPDKRPTKLDDIPFTKSTSTGGDTSTPILPPSTSTK